MAVITISEAVLAIQAIERLEGRVKPHILFELKKVKVVLEKSIEIARPLVTGDEKKDQWLNVATTLQFEPLVYEEIFKGLKKIKPEDFLAIKKLCSMHTTSSA